ncbi:MAG: hypothetical protein SH850_00745 [Planctomycetaceae bacterium]|nr:hypothetical protein [Planctomycetaceae bacterium]
MAQWEYRTLIYGTAMALPGRGWFRGFRRWVITAPTLTSPSEQVGEAEPDHFVGRIWQAMRLLETALKQLDVEGWELVSTSFSGNLGVYGTAVLRRPVIKE